jgi:hypothetical protein
VKIKVEGLTVTVTEYPKEIVLTFDDDFSMQHFLLNMVGLELGKIG